MAFDIRCPECKAKLRLDEAPDPDTPIECPLCGSQFAAPDQAPAADGKPAKKAGGPPKRKKAKKKRTLVPEFVQQRVARAAGRAAPLTRIGRGMAGIRRSRGTFK